MKKFVPEEITLPDKMCEIHNRSIKYFNILNKNANISVCAECMFSQSQQYVDFEFLTHLYKQLVEHNNQTFEILMKKQQEFQWVLQNAKEFLDRIALQYENELQTVKRNFKLAQKNLNAIAKTDFEQFVRIIGEKIKFENGSYGIRRSEEELVMTGNLDKIQQNLSEMIQPSDTTQKKVKIEHSAEKLPLTDFIKEQTDENTLLQVLTAFGNVSIISFDPNYKMASISHNHTKNIMIWKHKLKKWSVHLSQTSEDQIEMHRFSKQANNMIYGTKKCLVFNALRQSEPQIVFKSESDQLTAMCIALDSKIAASGWDSGIVRIFKRSENFQFWINLQEIPTSSSVSSMDMNDKIFCIANKVGTINVYKNQHNQFLWQQELKHHKTNIRNLVVQENKNMIYSGDEDKMIVVWGYIDGVFVINQMITNPESFNLIQLNGTGTQMMVQGDQVTMYKKEDEWKCAKQLNFGRQVHTAQMTNNFEILAISFKDPNIYIYKV